MRAGIFSCHHLPPKDPVRTGLFTTLVSNLPAPPDGRFLSDLDGENIAADPGYGEIRHHFHVWKSLLPQYDYVGFEHYRRMMFLNPLGWDRLGAFSARIARESDAFETDAKLHELQQDLGQFRQHVEMRRRFTPEDVARLTSWLAQHDVVVPRPWHLHDRPDLESEWKNSGLPPVMWDVMIDAMRAEPAFSPLPCHPVRTSYHGNIFAMRAALFDEYMRALFGCIERMRATLGERIHPFPRMWGYVAEKTLNYFILAKRKANPLFAVASVPLIIRTAAADVD